MKKDSFPYCIPDKRDMTIEERSLLKRLANDSVEIANHIDQLKVVARCGCGKCPTILFGKSLEDEPITSIDSHQVGEWMGRTTDGALVGIGLFVHNGRPTELEASSPEGPSIDRWPPIGAIEHCSG
jgi:hypothetical protein